MTVADSQADCLNTKQTKASFKQTLCSGTESEGAFSKTAKHALTSALQGCEGGRGATSSGTGCCFVEPQESPLDYGLVFQYVRHDLLTSFTGANNPILRDEAHGYDTVGNQFRSFAPTCLWPYNIKNKPVASIGFLDFSRIFAGDYLRLIHQGAAR